MAQKFVPLEDAAQQLGISKERLNELREGGKVRAYRDGTSWKFRSEDLAALSGELTPSKDPSVSDLALEALDEPSDPADSILVSDAEIGESPNRPPSTVIGEKRGRTAGESDLELALDEGSSKDVTSSRSAAGASDVLASGSGSHVLGPSETPPVASGKFEDLEEIDIDLETESSKIHSDIDLPKSRPTAQESDLQLVDSTIGGPSPSGSGGSEIRLAEDEDDDMVLSESGSDVTLSPGDSGINLISPSDSGLALDDLDLDLAGSSANKLEIDEAEEHVVLEEETETRGKSAAKDDDFLLTPLGEAGEDDSSSQVIELDSEAEFQESTAIITDRPAETAVLEPVEEEEGVFSAQGVGMPMAMAPVGAPAQAVEFTGANVAFLIVCLVILAICGVMMFDLLRHIWSWDQPFTINSTLIEALNFFD